MVFFIYTLKVNKSRMKWAGHARNMDKIRMHTKFWSVNLKGRHSLAETSVNGRILKWVGVKEDEDANCFHTAQDISVIKWHKISSCIIQSHVGALLLLKQPLQDISVIQLHKISSCIIQTVLSIQASTIIRSKGL